MAGQFTTGSAEMLAAVTSMEQVNTALQGNLKNLEGEVEGVASAWKGTAATAFQSLMAKFNEDAQKLNQDLQQIADAVRGNQQTYQAAEDEQHSSMTQILGGL
ncbi:MAG TPA: WXG100 family type VII secretion target [Pseudonocardiaceae bacterium]|nr:WXG100 family type VII secretion target [Pseudonocardiaceae bacterium]